MNVDFKNLERFKSARYTQNKIFSNNPLIRWAHRSRIVKAISLAEKYGGERVLDYGYGDGVLLQCLQDYHQHCAGVELSEDQVNRSRNLSFGKSSFMTADDYFDIDDERYDLIFCLEVFTHCDSLAIDNIINSFKRKLSYNGTLVISVPVEIGASLIFKQLARFVGSPTLKGPDSYNIREFKKMIFAGAETEIPRTFTDTRMGEIVYTKIGRKGFNWKQFENYLDKHFLIFEKFFSPMPFLDQKLNSQVWFVCKNK